MAEFMPSFETMHQEHRAWSADHAQWEIDIENWSAQIARSIAQLEEVERDLKAHEKALHAHSESILRHEARSARHEHSFALLDKWSVGSDSEEMVRRHLALIQDHHEEQRVHNALKQRNHLVVPEVARLVELVRDGKRSKRP